jgi:hypothetical protein
MTNQTPMTGRQRPVPSLPKGEVLRSYDTYPEAQAAVDRLAHSDFDVTNVSIVGSDLKTVERVTGKLSWGRVAGAGAASGAWLGLFFGLVLFLFAPTTNALLYTGAAVVIGAGFGILFGIVSYAINRRTRDFTSSHQVLASRYEVIVPGEQLVRAQEVLARPAQHD